MTFRFLGIIILFHLSSSESLSGQTGTRANYLTFKDTLQIGRESGRLFIKHTVAQGQTLYGVSRFYGLELEELLYYNRQYKVQMPGIKDTLFIPVPKKAILPFRYPNYARWKGAPLYYTVQKGETLYQISQRYFGLPVEQMKQFNNLKEENIQPGNKLFVGWLSTKGIPDSIRQFSGHPLWIKSHRLRSQYMQGRKTGDELQDQGYGTRILADNPDDELVVLHNGSALNSPVALKNPLNNRIVFARVIGRIPPGTYPPGTVVVTSNAVSRMLGVKDHRFFIRLKYLNI